MKKILIAVVVCAIIVAAGLGYHIHAESKEEIHDFKDHVAICENGTGCDALLVTEVYQDDVRGWFFYEKDDALYMGMQYVMQDKEGRDVLSASEFALSKTFEGLDADGIETSVERTGENCFHVVYSKDGSELMNLNIQYSCESSDGAASAEITVTDGDIGEEYYSAKRDSLT